jgi:hypothetical protein
VAQLVFLDHPFRGHPIQLYGTTFALKGWMPVPTLGAALEGQEHAATRRYFFAEVIEIGAAAQNSQATRALRPGIGVEI